jgi:quercetin dioxygenase-like cupin family protein
MHMPKNEAIDPERTSFSAFSAILWDGPCLLPVRKALKYACRDRAEQELHMSVDGIVLHHGEAGGVTLHQTRVDYLLTAEHSKQCSLFEFTIAPGFNTGAHYHTKIEEIFYVLEGELDLRCGDRTVHGKPGTFVFVPPGTAHAFGNSGSAPGRMLLITAPSGHEKYFDELRDLVAKGKPDPDLLAKLRAKYDTVQLATLTPG